MANIERKIKKLQKLYFEVSELISELAADVEKHLGEGWFITHDMGDGVLLCSPDACNYPVSTYLETVNMPREEAITYIRDFSFHTGL